jgi:hypothetical protein
VKLIKKKIEDSPRRWDEVLFEALWAHCISRHGATKVTPYELVYGQEVILPVEVNLGAYRLAKQNNLDVETYCALMMNNIDEVTDKRLEAVGGFRIDHKRFLFLFFVKALHNAA